MNEETRAARLRRMTTGESMQDAPEAPTTVEERWLLATELLTFGLALQGVTYPRYHGKEGRMSWVARRFRVEEP